MEPAVAPAAAQPSPPVPNPWRTRLDSALALEDEAARSQALLAFLDAARQELAPLERNDPARDVVATVYASALYEADMVGLLPIDDPEQLAAWTAPVREFGPAASAASIAYLAAFAVSIDDPARALEWLRDCDARFPNESYAEFERLDLQANLEHRSGRPGEGLRLVSAAIARAEARDDPPRAALIQMLGTRAEIHFDLGLYDVADVDLDRAETMAAELGTIDAQFDVLTIRLDHDLGISRFKQVLRRSESRERFGPEHAAVIAVYRAAAYRHLAPEVPDAFDEAVRLLEAALGSGSLPMDMWITAVQKQLAIELDRGGLERARELCAQLEAVHDLTVASFAADVADLTAFDSAALITRFAIAGGDHDAMRERLAIQRAAFDAMLRRWDSVGIRDGGVGRLHLDRWGRTAGEYLRLLMALDPGEKGVELAFEALLQVQARASLSIALAAPVPGLEVLRRALAPKQGILVFFPIDHATLVFTWRFRNPCG